MPFPLLRVAWAAAATCLACACSPYVYKKEVDGFAQGVAELRAAYTEGRASAAALRDERQGLVWEQGGASLALTEGCVPAMAGDPGVRTPCALVAVAFPSLPPTRTETQAAAAAPLVTALHQYALSLAAVTNAADRQALVAAQAQLKTSVQGLAKSVAGTTVASVGPVLDLFAAVSAAMLDRRRYEILRDGVTTADASVAIVGAALGETLDALRIDRASELRRTANLNVDSLRPGTPSAEYALRLRAAREHVAALEALRTSNPKEAARDMVAAHGALAAALNDDSRQDEAVAAAILAFVDKATAVKQAFAK